MGTALERDEALGHDVPRASARYMGDAGSPVLALTTEPVGFNSRVLHTHLTGGSQG